MSMIDDIARIAHAAEACEDLLEQIVEALAKARTYTKPDQEVDSDPNSGPQPPYQRPRDRTPSGPTMAEIERVLQARRSLGEIVNGTGGPAA